MNLPSYYQSLYIERGNKCMGRLKNMHIDEILSYYIIMFNIDAITLIYNAIKYFFAASEDNSGRAVSDRLRKCQCCALPQCLVMKFQTREPRREIMSSRR
jgi:hypothetical protein